MFHRRCQQLEEILQNELDEARARIRELEQELNARMYVMPHHEDGEGKVYYMDDAAMKRLEDGPA
jgi:hypothetical protein